MKKLVVPIIVNYNMPERADDLAENLACCPDTEFILVDNGSDKMPVADLTTLILPKNVQTTNGWLAGVDMAVKMFQDRILAFMFVITSAEIISDDVVSSMREVLDYDSNAVGVHPALTTDSTTSWKHMITRGGRDARRTWMIDNICSMYRAEWWLKNSFDPELIYAWGIDLETCYKARREGRALYIDENVQVRKITDIGYTMDRMNMTSEERQNLARQNMIDVLERKYGLDWRRYMKAQYVEDYMR